MEGFSYSLVSFDNSIENIPLEPHKSIILGRNMISKINDICVSRSLVNVKLKYNNKGRYPYLIIKIIGKSKVSKKESIHSHSYDLCFNESCIILCNNVIVIHGSECEYNYVFQVKEYSLSSLLEKEKQLAKRLDNIRKIISKKQLSCEENEHSSILNINMSSTNIPFNNSYSIKSLNEIKHYFGIITKNIPNDKAILKQLPNTIKPLKSKTIDNIYKLYTNISKTNSIICYEETQTRYLITSSSYYKPIDLYSFNNIHFIYVSFENGNIINNPKIDSYIFIPLFNWIINLKISNELYINSLKLLCDKYINPKQTKFPKTMIILIINELLQSCIVQDEFIYTYDKISLLVLFIYYILKSFKSYKGIIKLQLNTFNTYNIIINYFNDSLYEDILPILIHNNNNTNTCILEYVLNHLQPMNWENKKYYQSSMNILARIQSKYNINIKL